jgi:hypothetical protein
MFKVSNATKSNKIKVRLTVSQSLLFGSKKRYHNKSQKKRQKCHVVSSQLAMDVRLLRAAETSSTNVAPFIEREVHVFANYAQVW